MHCAAMEKKGVWSLTREKSWSMDTILKQEPSINSIDASGTDILALQGLTNDKYRKMINLEN